MSELHHWVVEEPGGGFDYRTTTEYPPDRSKWTGLENAPYHEVDRAPVFDLERPDGKGGWTVDIEKLRARRLTEALVHRDAQLALDPPLPDSDDHEAIGRHIVRHIGHCHAAHRHIARQIAAAETAEQLTSIDHTAGYPPTS